VKLQSLRLTNFRNYEKGEFLFNEKAVLILGPNASGKTNLLEALFLLATGKSFKAESAQQMIHWGRKFAVVEGRIQEGEEEATLLIQMEREAGKVTKKKFFLNGVAKPRKDFLPILHAIVFRPEDIRVISGPPTRRRNLLNEILVDLDWRYRQSLRLYRKALKQRNRLLDEIRERKASEQELFYWNNALVKNGSYLIEERKKLVGFINHFFTHSSHSLFWQLSLHYQVNPITLEKLKLFQEKDVKTGWTSAGPHKDFLVVEGGQFRAEDKNIAFWGSRAQQRLAVLGLKLAQSEFVFQKTQHRPVLLLDDIFSELDEEQRRLLRPVFHSHQVIVTSTHLPDGNMFSWQKKIVLNRLRNT